MNMDDLERQRKPKPNPTDDYILPLDEPTQWKRWSTLEEIAWMRSRLSKLNTYTNHVRTIIEANDKPKPVVIKEPEPSGSRRPLWLPSSYRPKMLTEYGGAALASLGPNEPGILGYPTTSLTSLSDRRDMLAARYAAHDMIRRGYAVEVMGTYHFRKDSLDYDRLRAGAYRWMPQSDGRMNRYELGHWLAIYRVATTDQIFTLEPENAYNNFQLLLEMESQDKVRRSQVRMGLGTIEIWYLGPKFWRELNHEHPEMETKGFGPMRTAMVRPNGMVSTAGRGNAFGHPLLQVDAIQWFFQEAELDGKDVADLQLERSLRREAENQQGQRFPDFRMWTKGPGGIPLPKDIEVIGTGSQYRSRAKKAYLASSKTLHRSFSDTPHQIELVDHVCIGR